MDVKQEIKDILMNENTTLTRVVNMINAINPQDKQTTIQNINNKLSRGTIKYNEVLEIADVLGYDIIWKKKNINEFNYGKFNTYSQQELNRPRQTGVNYERVRTDTIPTVILEQEITKFYINIIYLLTKFKYSPAQEAKIKSELNALTLELKYLPMMSFIFQYSDYICNLLYLTPNSTELTNMIQQLRDLYFRTGLTKLNSNDRQNLIDSFQYFKNVYFNNLQFIEDYHTFCNSILNKKD